MIRCLSVCCLAERGVVRNLLETNESPGWWELGSGARANRESFLGGWRRRRNTPFQELRNFRDKPICRVTHTFHSLVCESFEPDSRWTKRASLVSMFLANSMSEVSTLRFRSSSSKGIGHLDIVLQIEIETLGLKEDHNLP